MAEYIKRETAIKRVMETKWESGSDGAAAMEIVAATPAADVAPVVHGRWRYFHKKNIAVCTECSFERDLDTNFGRAVNCPNCGAKMDGVDDG